MINRVGQKTSALLLFIIYFLILPRSIPERIGGGSIVHATIDFLPSEIVV